MQISPLGAGGATLDRALATGGVAATRPVVDTRPVQAELPVAFVLPTHAGLRTLDPSRNQRVASAQQALDWLDRLAPRLQNLKSDLAGQIAGQPVPAERLENQRQRLQQTLAERPARAGGELDAQLRYTPGQPAVQAFTVRGLETPPAVQETLAVALGIPSAVRPAVRLRLDPEADPATQARAVDQALLPLGLRAQAGEQGGLRFEVAESRWPQVRTGLAVQGEGKRFPAGRLHQVAADATPGVLAPQGWQLQDADGARQALREVAEAQGRADTARRQARSVLEQERLALAGQQGAEEGDWAAGFVDDFAAVLQQGGSAREGGYRLQAGLVAAVSGVGRQRVERLLDGAG